MPCSIALTIAQVKNEGHMLRITENLENGKAVRLRLDGTLDSLSLPGLEEVCSRHQSDDGKVILLDLAGLAFMNNDSAKKLIELRGDRFRIINCSPFIETLLETVDK
jgi:anti-anti-sigma regulatory factor